MHRIYIGMSMLQDNKVVKVACIHTVLSTCFTVRWWNINRPPTLHITYSYFVQLYLYIHEITTNMFYYAHNFSSVVSDVRPTTAMQLSTSTTAPDTFLRTLQFRKTTTGNSTGSPILKTACTFRGRRSINAICQPLRVTTSSACE